MVIKYRQEEYAENTRRAIIEGAIELFAGNGYRRTSLDEVADRARVSKGAIYHHFSNKQDVFEAALKVVVGSHVSVISNPVRRPAEKQLALNVLFNSYLDICVDPLFSRLVLQEGPIALGWARWRVFEEEFILDNLVEPARQWLRDGYTVRVSPEMLLRALVSAIHEMALTIVDSPEPKRATAEARALINELVGSLDRLRSVG